MSESEFDHDVEAAKRAADTGPVVITDRGRAAYVLLSAPEYDHLTDEQNVVDLLQRHDDIDFEAARLDSEPRAADL